MRLSTEMLEDAESLQVPKPTSRVGEPLCLGPGAARLRGPFEAAQLLQDLCACGRHQKRLAGGGNVDRYTVLEPTPTYSSG
ncbi:MAG TPA: hypothetical protein PKD61_20940 [Polyangiaceae bacterium]|nr:hypothetical protein [Polyangiaceae bacterium]